MIGIVEGTQVTYVVDTTSRITFRVAAQVMPGFRFQARINRPTESNDWRNGWPIEEGDAISYALLDLELRGDYQVQYRTIDLSDGSTSSETNLGEPVHIGPCIFVDESDMRPITYKRAPYQICVEFSEFRASTLRDCTVVARLHQADGAIVSAFERLVSRPMENLTAYRLGHFPLHVIHPGACWIEYGVIPEEASEGVLPDVFYRFDFLFNPVFDPAVTRSNSLLSVAADVDGSSAVTMQYRVTLAGETPSNQWSNAIKGETDYFKGTGRARGSASCEIPGSYWVEMRVASTENNLLSSYVFAQEFVVAQSYHLTLSPFAPILSIGDARFRGTLDSRFMQGSVRVLLDDETRDSPASEHRLVTFDETGTQWSYTLPPTTRAGSHRVRIIAMYPEQTPVSTAWRSFSLSVPPATPVTEMPSFFDRILESPLLVTTCIAAAGVSAAVAASAIGPLRINRLRR